MPHHKRRRPANRRRGCKLCKQWKINGARTERADGEKFSDHVRRESARLDVVESFRISWQQATNEQTHPIEELWDGIDGVS